MNASIRNFLPIVVAFAWPACLAQGEFAFEKTDDHLILSENGRPVLVFNHGEIQPPPEWGVARSGYVHPLYGPDGDELTDDFPLDHPHHRGVYFAWPQMTVLGEPVDLWHLKKLHPYFEEFGPREAGEKNAAFEATNLWRLKEDGTEVVRERLRYTVRAADATGRAIDIHATFTNLTGEPVSLRGSKASAYGGLNIRMDGERPDVRIATAEGPVEGNVNAIDPPSPWADHSSRPGSGRPHSGVAIFQHPDNPGFPARNWTLRPYGFLGAAWPGETDHEIEPGDSLDLRYRLFVHRGTAGEAGVAERFEAYEREPGKR